MRREVTALLLLAWAAGSVPSGEMALRAGSSCACEMLRMECDLDGGGCCTRMSACSLDPRSPAPADAPAMPSGLRPAILVDLASASGLPRGARLEGRVTRAHEAPSPLPPSPPPRLLAVS